MRPANANELGMNVATNAEPHTARVTSHLSVCSGGMVFFRLRGSCHGRAGISRPPHQLSPIAGEWESLPLECGPARSREWDRPRWRESVLAIRESASSRDGDGLRAVDVVESTRKRRSTSLSGGEGKGVARFGKTDGFKGEDIFTVDDDSEDELWGNGGSGKDFSLGELLGEGVGLLDDEDMADG